MLTRTFVVLVCVGLFASALHAGIHAPWPSDWNNWSDPALWVTVGDPGNVGQWSGGDDGTWGADRICGAVDYVYQIGKFEVTAGQYTEFLNAVAAEDTHGLYNTRMDTAVDSWGPQIIRSGVPGSYTYGVPADYANRPVRSVSFWDAARFVNWLDNGRPTGAQGLTTTEDGTYFLNGVTNPVDTVDTSVRRNAEGKYAVSSEDEWYKAAYYKGDSTNAGYWDYPTSSDSLPSNELIDPDPGNNANHDGFPSGPFPIDSGIFYTTVAGEFELSGSPYGTFDQGGNVWEWNDDVFYDIYDAGEPYRGIRGGSYDERNYHLHERDRGYGSVPQVEMGNVGFRVVMIPEPATLGLLTLGGVVILRRRRRGICRTFGPRRPAKVKRTRAMVKSKPLGCFALVGLVLSVAALEASAGAIYLPTIVSDGIEYDFRTDKQIYAMGDQVNMLFKITNLQPQEVVFADPQDASVGISGGDESLLRSAPRDWPGLLAPGESAEATLSWDMMFPYALGPGEMPSPDSPWHPASPGQYEINWLFEGFGSYGVVPEMLSVTIQIIPEPASAALLAIGWLGLMRRRRRK